MRALHRLAPALAVLLACVASPAQEAEVPRVTVELDQVDIHEVVKLLAEQTGKDFVVTPEVTGAVTARFDNERLDKVMRLLALTLGAELRVVEDVYILRQPAAEAQPGGGAGSLLPGAAPTAPLPTAGDSPSLVGGPAPELPEKPKIVQETIPLNHADPKEVARALGGGWIDANGQMHQPGEPTWTPSPQPRYNPAQGDPYQNLPPGARVTREGIILLPNGTTIMPNGTVITKDGTVYQPQQYPTSYRVPYGTTPGMWQQQQGYVPYQREGYLGGNVGGVGFGLGQNSGLTVQPPKIKVGGATITVPGFQLGGQDQPTYYQPVPGYPAGTFYPGYTSPNVHLGQRPGDWYYGTPPDWQITAPAGAPVYPGYTAPRGPGAHLPVAPPNDD